MNQRSYGTHPYRGEQALYVTVPLARLPKRPLWSRSRDRLRLMALHLMLHRVMHPDVQTSLWRRW